MSATDEDTGHAEDTERLRRIVEEQRQRIEDLLDTNNRYLQRARDAEALAQERLDGLLAAARFTTTLGRELKLEGLQR